MLRAIGFVLAVVISLIDADLPIAYLTADNPSYAIHGITLDFYEQVRIESCTNCQLIFDVTFRETPNEISFTYNGKTALYNCAPNSLDDGMDTMTQCTWAYNQSSTVLKIGATTRFEFGISVRVQEWTEDSFDVKLMPVHEYVNATMSTSKITVGSKDARRGTVATFLARSPKEPCTYFLNAYVVPASCVYEIVAGGAPGTHGNLRNLLQRLNATTSLLTSRILSSAFSVVIPAGCEATLQVLDYQTTAEVTSFFGPGKFIITSPNYPWIFDEGKTAPANYSQLYLPITYKDTYSVDFWLDRIEGSYVSIFLEQYTQQGTVSNMFNATMNVLTNGNLTGSSGQGLAVGWYPKAGDGRKGFVCRGVAYDSRAAPTAWPVTETVITTSPSTTDEPSSTSPDPTATTTKITNTTFSSFSLVFFIIYRCLY